MSNALPLASALLAGVALGTMFFGGLWWTIRRGVVSTVPAVWFLGSVTLRTTTTVVGFYLVARHDWRMFVACLLGFAIARVGVGRYTRGSLAQSVHPIPGWRP